MTIRAFATAAILAGLFIGAAPAQAGLPTPRPGQNGLQALQDIPPQACGPDGLNVLLGMLLRAYNAKQFGVSEGMADKIIEGCAASPLTPENTINFVRMVAGMSALRNQDYDYGIAVVGPSDRPAPLPVGSTNNWIMLRLYEAKGDAAGIDREADRLAQAVETHLTDPKGAYHAQKKERFQQGDTVIDGYEIETAWDDKETTQSYFLVRPHGQLPYSVVLAHHTADGKDSWALSGATCMTRQTFETDTARRSYAEARAGVVDIVTGKIKLDTVPEAGRMICQAKNIALGLDDMPKDSTGH